MFTFLSVGIITLLAGLPTTIHGAKQGLRHRLQTNSPVYSSLWGTDGNGWDGSGLLRDFTNAGYMMGDAEIPYYPPCAFDFSAHWELSDVAAIRLALEICPNNTAVVIPEGTWIVDEPIIIPRDNIVLRGESRDGTILFFPKNMNEILGTPRANGDDAFMIQFLGGTQRGIEDISLIFREEQKETGFYLDTSLTKQRGPHWFFSGVKAVIFDSGEHDSWLRNCFIKNANYGLKVKGLGTQHISVLDLVIDNFPLRSGPNDLTVGHVGMAVGAGSRYNLIHNVMIHGK